MGLRLKKFDMRMLTSDAVVVMLGKRGTGKSFLIRDILHRHRDIPLGTIISPSEEANQFFTPLVPSFFIHDEYTEGLVNRVVGRQKKVMKVYNNDRNIDPRSFVVFDDCMFDDTWTRDKNVRLLFMNGRHYKSLFMITMQYPLGIPPVLRTNVDFVFILRENITSNRKRIYEHWAGIFPNFKMFCSVLDQCTANYECLVINNRAKSNNIEDVVFWYKAKSHKDFKLGSPVFWKMDNTYKKNNKIDNNTNYNNQLMKGSKKDDGLYIQKLT